MGRQGRGLPGCVAHCRVVKWRSYGGGEIICRNRRRLGVAPAKVFSQRLPASCTVNP